jgi:hypothetical protein
MCCLNLHESCNLNDNLSEMEHKLAKVRPTPSLVQPTPRKIVGLVLSRFSGQSPCDRPGCDPHQLSETQFLPDFLLFFTRGINGSRPFSPSTPTALDRLESIVWRIFDRADTEEKRLEDLNTNFKHSSEILGVLFFSTFFCVMYCYYVINYYYFCTNMCG